jgi:hypothetical protein
MITPHKDYPSQLWLLMLAIDFQSCVVIDVIFIKVKV